MKDNPPIRATSGPGAAQSGSAPDLGAKHAHLDQADQAHQALVGHLRSGSLGSGMFLSMPMLVTQLGFPLAAVREAVKRAEASALVKILPKRGVMVMHGDAQTTRECMELRAILDIHGARRLLPRLQDMPLAALRTAHERLRDDAATAPGTDMQRRAIETDLSLHEALSKGLDGPVMGRIYADNRDRIAVIQNQRPFLADRIIPAMTEHLAIISALEARDLPQIQQAIWDHLINTLRWWGIDTSDSTGAPTR